MALLRLMLAYCLGERGLDRRPRGLLRLTPENFASKWAASKGVELSVYPAPAVLELQSAI